MLWKQMRVVRLGAILHSLKRTQFSHASFVGASRLSTATTRDPRTSKFWGSTEKVSPLGEWTVWMFEELDEMVENGKTVGEYDIKGNIDMLLNKSRHWEALEMHMWNKRYFELTAGDIAVRLVLIFCYKGIEEAEIFFGNISENLRTIEVYIALLYCYASLDSVYKSESVKKAEATMQTLRDLGLDRETMAYNCMLNLYHQTGKLEKIESTVLEMEEKGIVYNEYTFYIGLSAYAAVSDGKGIEKMVTMMESDPNFVVDFSVYAIAASGYAKAGLLDKTYAMLKKCEELALGGNDEYPRYDFLISKYAEFGNKDDVLRVWEFCKKNAKGWYVAGSVIPSVLKFDDLEIAEKILEEVNWPIGNPHYCIHIINPLIAAYCRKGLLQKAEDLINNAQSRGLNPDVRTWYLMATGYLQNDQTEKAMEAMTKSICDTGIGWIPPKECLAVFLKWLEAGKDTEEAEHLANLERDVFFSLDLEDDLLNYFQHGYKEKNP